MWKSKENKAGICFRVFGQRYAHVYRMHTCAGLLRNPSPENVASTENRKITKTNKSNNLTCLEIQKAA